jgi:hypothetical protein
MFLLVVEGLSRAIEEKVREKKLEVYQWLEGSCITHLMFVDDVILFGNGNIVEWEVFKEILTLFVKLQVWPLVLKNPCF